MPYQTLGQLCETMKAELLAFTDEHPELIRTNHTRGEIVLSQGAKQDIGYFIEKGKLVSSAISEGGEIRHKEFYFPGELCILYAEWIRDLPSHFQLAVIEDAILVHVPLSLFKQQTTTELKLKLFQQQLLFKEAKEAFLLLNTVEERYRFLLEYRTDWVMKITNQDLANYLGCTAQGLSRIKNRIKKTN